MTTLLTRVSEGFDPSAPSGLLVCAEELDSTHGFTEQGYDTADYDVAPIVYEVIPTVSKFATESEAISVARAAGIRIFDTHEAIERAVADGTFSGSWIDGDCYCLEEDPINRLVLESRDIRTALEKAGILAIRDHIAIGNTAPVLTLLWVPGTFEMEGPVTLARKPGADTPYEVEWPRAAPSGGPRP